jgi:hypothetical protein
MLEMSKMTHSCHGRGRNNAAIQLREVLQLSPKGETMRRREFIALIGASVWPISTRVNKPENDDPSIVEPIELSAA